MNLYSNVSQLIGKTPLLELRHWNELHKIPATVCAKVESVNPTGSAKDRAALFMIDDAEARGILKPGATIIEPTSGNTGIGLASIGASRGYRVILTMPDSMSQERITLLKAYGAQVILTPGALGMAGSIARAEELSREIPGSWIPNQFGNPANALAHEKTTGPEIWEDTDSQVAAFVAGIGTGGTISGVARFLKAQNPDVKIFGVEPKDSPLLTEGHAGPHKLQGIGANFIPEILEQSLLDEVLAITTEEAYEGARSLAACEGLLAGITGGAALAAAAKIAVRPEFRGKLIVCLLPDTGDRYLSTDLFQ